MKVESGEVKFIDFAGIMGVPAFYIREPDNAIFIDLGFMERVFDHAPELKEDFGRWTKFLTQMVLHEYLHVLSNVSSSKEIEEFFLRVVLEAIP